MYFYELHEGDDDVFSDLLVASEVEYEPEDFFELVQSIRRRIQDSFEDDTLIVAIAEELEREHGFLYISDERLTAAVNVSRDEDDNFLAVLDPEEAPVTDGAAEFRTIVADLELGDGESGGRRPH